MNQKQLQEFIHKTSQSGSILGMESIVHLCQELGNPQEKGRIIHIAGTNGKGSTGILLQNALMELGYKVGRYSSPAVFAYEEMFQIQGEPISETDQCKMYSLVKEACDRMVEQGYPHPTIFEVETAVAYTYFSMEKCDFAIVEVGMGGRSDATNLVKAPVVSVISSVSMDHMAFLGESLEEIAGMKAGIIKTGCPVVALHQTESVMQVLFEEANQKKAPLRWANGKETRVLDMTPDGMRVSIKGEEYQTKMTGECQVENITLAREVLATITEYGHVSLDETKIKKAFEHTRWPGRFETIGLQPRFIIDGAHNSDAAEKLAQSIQRFFGDKRISFLVGVLKDKEYGRILEKVLPLGIRAYCITPDSPRALDAEVLANKAREVVPQISVEAFSSIEEAVLRVYQDCEQEDVIVAFGSLSYLAKVKDMVMHRMEEK